jgi:hypothetical protein
LHAIPWLASAADLMPAIVAFAAVTLNGLCHCCDSGDLLCAVGVLLLDLETEEALKGSEALLWPEKPRRAPMREPGKKGETGWLHPCAEKAIMVLLQAQALLSQSAT